MTETREAFDPFEGKTVTIRNDLVRRLRGQYAIGPTLPSGEPEFGWRQFETPPIQHEAADEIVRLREVVNAPLSPSEMRLVDKHCDWIAFQHAWNAVMKRRREALADGPSPETKTGEVK